MAHACVGHWAQYDSPTAWYASTRVHFHSDVNFVVVVVEPALVAMSVWSSVQLNGTVCTGRVLGAGDVCRRDHLKLALQGESGGGGGGSRGGEGGRNSLVVDGKSVCVDVQRGTPTCRRRDCREPCTSAEALFVCFIGA